MAENLTLLIAAYKAGLAEFNANAPADDGKAFDAYADATFRPPLDAIRSFEGAADNDAEASLALETALIEMDNGDYETAEPMIRAAALYLRGAVVSP
jgi:hypothetical protein